jgi:hypothetical protein
MAVLIHVPTPNILRIYLFSTLCLLSVCPFCEKACDCEKAGADSPCYCCGFFLCVIFLLVRAVMHTLRCNGSSFFFLAIALLSLHGSLVWFENLQTLILSSLMIRFSSNLLEFQWAWLVLLCELACFIFIWCWIYLKVFIWEEKLPCFFNGILNIFAIILIHMSIQCIPVKLK